MPVLKLNNPAPPTSERGRLTGTSPLTAAIASEDVLIAGSYAGSIVGWSRRDRRRCFSMRGHQGPITALTMLEGHSLLSAGRDGQVVLWDPLRQLPLAVFSDHQGAINDMLVLGNNLITCGDDKRIVLRNLHTRAVSELGGATTSLTALACDGERLAVGGADGSVVLWSIADEPELLHQHTAAITDMLFVGGRLLTASVDATIRCWSDTVHILQGHSGPVRCLASDGRRLLSGGDDQQLVVWSLDTLTALGSIAGHHRPVVATGWLGEEIFTASLDRTARSWSLPEPPVHAPIRHQSAVRSCAVAGQTLVTASRDGTLHLRPLDSAQQPQQLHGHRGAIQDVVPSPDGQRIASISTDGTVRLWSTSGDLLQVLCDDRGPLHCGVWLDDDRLLVGATDGTAQTWHLEDARQGALLSGHQARVRGCARHPDGQRVVTASYDGTVRLWRGTTCQAVLPLGSCPVICCAFSPSGRWLAAGNLDGTIGVWDLHALPEHGPLPGHRALSGHSACISDLAFSPEGLLLSTSKDSTLRMWDVETGSCQAQHRCPEPLDSVATWPGGIAAGDIGGNIWLFSAEEARPMPPAAGRITASAATARRRGGAGPAQ